MNNKTKNKAKQSQFAGLWPEARSTKHEILNRMSGYGKKYKRNLGLSAVFASSAVKEGGRWMIKGRKQHFQY